MAGNPGVHSGVTEPVKFVAAEMQVREWWDNTGTYRISAKLVEVQAQRVLLATDDGRRVSVVWRRLSAADQQHVRQQLAFLKRAELDKSVVNERPSA